jgi:hypothetical protein
MASRHIAQLDVLELIVAPSLGPKRDPAALKVRNRPLQSPALPHGSAASIAMLPGPRFAATFAIPT